MAEDLVKSSEFGNFTQKNDEEDPILVVQRFLNIFRQLHIFNDRKREEFNKMVLDLPDDIRGKFTAVPGGTLLQEYAKEIEIKNGITRDFIVVDAAKDYSDEIAKAKIFAQAMAEAQAKFSPPSPQMVQSAPIIVAANEEVIKLQDRLRANKRAMEEAVATGNAEKAEAIKKENVLINDKLKTVAANSGQPYMGNSGLSGDLKVIADKTFAKEMALAFAQAMQVIEQQRPASPTSDVVDNTDILSKIVEISKENSKENMETIAKTISESQIKLAQMLIEHNAANAIRVEAHNTNGDGEHPTVAPSVPQMPPLQDIIGGVIKAQTEQLSSMITGALKESHQLSSQSIVDALSSFQQDNKKLIEVQQKNAELKAIAKAKIAKAKAVEAVPVAEVIPEPLKMLSSGPVVKAEIKEEITKAGLDMVLFDIDDIETPANAMKSNKNIKTMTEVDKNFVIDKNEVPSKGRIVFESHEDNSIEFSPPKTAEPKKDDTPKPIVTEEEWEWQESKKGSEYEVKELENKPGIVDAKPSSDVDNGYMIYDSDEDEIDTMRDDYSEASDDDYANEEQSDESQDEEWEWEEVEVDEDGNESTTQEDVEDGDSDEEWEWEYEEVEEDQQ